MKELFVISILISLIMFVVGIKIGTEGHNAKMSAEIAQLQVNLENSQYELKQCKILYRGM